MDTTATALTIAQRRVLAALSTTPQTDSVIRDRLAMPRTAAAGQNVRTVLADLVQAGLVARTSTPGERPRYAVAPQVVEARHARPGQYLYGSARIESVETTPRGWVRIVTDRATITLPPEGLLEVEGA